MYHRIGEKGKKYWGKKGAGIVFTDGTKILLLRRAGKSDNAGTWGLPGGKSEDGETPIDTAKREAKEEIGSCPGTNIADFEDNDHRHKFKVFLFKVKEPFEVELSQEHDDFIWANIDLADELNLHPRLKKNLDRYGKVIQEKCRKLKTFSEWVAEKD